MERGSITKWLLFALAAFLFFTYGWPKITGSSKEGQLQPFTVDDQTAPAERAPEATCTIEREQYSAVLSTKGGSLQSFKLKDPRFTKNGAPQDLVTTTRESRMPLRTDLRLPGAQAQQVPYDDLDWKLTAQDGKSCTFTYEDPSARLTKTITASDKPYQLETTLQVENLAGDARKHRLAFELTAWREHKETKGGFLQAQPEITDVTAGGTKTEHHHPDDFEPGDFKDKEFTNEQWRRAPGDGNFVGVSTSYFTKVAEPIEGPRPPVAETQIEERWNSAQFGANKDRDPHYGYVYRARLAYPEVTLQPKESVTYRVLAYLGPKDRAALAAMPRDATDVLNLGTFSIIAQGLMKYLSWLYGLVRNWGVAIILLTITVRMVLFPLTLAQIKSSIAMRALKPEMDAINEKYKEDAVQRGVAIQELWRKNKVANPFVGCMPMLVQMPVWFALYTALQKAVELYHVRFLWFPDLTAPDKLFIMPIVLGATSFIQQKIMPPQGDPQQQKMMMYMMPAVFTFMMLFLPAGLGVYMLTNSLVGIFQQLAVERYAKTRGGGTSGGIEVREKSPDDGGKPSPMLGKGKARVRG